MERIAELHDGDDDLTVSQSTVIVDICGKKLF